MRCRSWKWYKRSSNTSVCLLRYIPLIHFSYDKGSTRWQVTGMGQDAPVVMGTYRFENVYASLSDGEWRSTWCPWCDVHDAIKPNLDETYSLMRDTRSGEGAWRCRWYAWCDYTEPCWCIKSDVSTQTQETEFADVNDNHDDVTQSLKDTCMQVQNKAFGGVQDVHDETTPSLEDVLSLMVYAMPEEAMKVWMLIATRQHRVSMICSDWSRKVWGYVHDGHDLAVPNLTHWRSWRPFGASDPCVDSRTTVWGTTPWWCVYGSSDPCVDPQTTVWGRMKWD